MKIKTTGAVLVTVLLFVLVLTMLVLAVTERSLLAIKTNQAITQEQQAFYRSSKAINVIAGKDIANEACQLSTPTTSEFFTTQTSAWWKSNSTCHLNSHTEYVISHLQDIEQTKFYRITVRTTADDDSFFDVQQAVVAVSNKNTVRSWRTI